MEAVQHMLFSQALASRDLQRIMLSADCLVPGDVVHVQSGDRIPADVRLLRARDLRVDEATLTRKSMPVRKSVEPVPAQASIGNRTCMAFSGTRVTFERGTGVVTGTGRNTEIGHISDLLAKVETLTTPLLRHLAAFGRWLTAVVAGVAVLTFAFGTLVHDYSAGGMFLAAVGLAVAAIPEGLPAIITTTLAVGVQRMARRSATVRRLPAVETLGSVTTICSDKTGTLTRNEMTVQQVVLASGTVAVSGVGYEPRGGFAREGTELRPEADPVLKELTRAGVSCNDADVRETSEGWRVEGNPTEGALTVLGGKPGIDLRGLAEQLPRTDVILFESEHRIMATLHHDHEGYARVYVKGAPEVLLPRCRAARGSEGDLPLDAEKWTARVEPLPTPASAHWLLRSSPYRRVSRASRSRTSRAD